MYGPLGVTGIPPVVKWVGMNAPVLVAGVVNTAV
jgi:hypothetical protein